MPVAAPYFVGALAFCSELLHFGGNPRIHAGEERFSAPKTLRARRRALALAL
jgi:hypothetical protein